MPPHKLRLAYFKLLRNEASFRRAGALSLCKQADCSVNSSRKVLTGPTVNNRQPSKRSSHLRIHYTPVLPVDKMNRSTMDIDEDALEDGYLYLFFPSSSMKIQLPSNNDVPDSVEHTHVHNHADPQPAQSQDIRQQEDKRHTGYAVMLSDSCDTPPHSSCRKDSESSINPASSTITAACDSQADITPSPPEPRQDNRQKVFVDVEHPSDEAQFVRVYPRVHVEQTLAGQPLIVDLTTSDSMTPREKEWEHNFNLLLSYWRKYGHCRVPVEQGELGSWVKRQREMYQLKNNGKINSLTEERIKRLESIGFRWRIRTVLV